MAMMPKAWTQCVVARFARGCHEVCTLEHINYCRGDIANHLIWIPTVGLAKNETVGILRNCWVSVKYCF